jgi:sensor c-di-GMP phosphodiesterase-like protein
MIEMARTLDIGTLTEGVETEAQLAFLRSRGCDAGRGFLFGRPMLPEAFASFIRSHPAGVGRRSRQPAD